MAESHLFYEISELGTALHPRWSRADDRERESGDFLLLGDGREIRSFEAVADRLERKKARTKKGVRNFKVALGGEGLGCLMRHWGKACSKKHAAITPAADVFVCTREPGWLLERLSSNNHLVANETGLSLPCTSPVLSN